MKSSHVLRLCFLTANHINSEGSCALLMYKPTSQRLCCLFYHCSDINCRASTRGVSFLVCERFLTAPQCQTTTLYQKKHLRASRGSWCHSCYLKCGTITVSLWQRWPSPAAFVLLCRSLSCPTGTAVISWRYQAADSSAQSTFERSTTWKNIWTACLCRLRCSK